MQSALPVLIVIAVVATFVVLLSGVVSMVRGGTFNRAHGNKLMRLRVATQAVAIGLLGLAFFLSKG
jgi:hypothetical protein